MNKVMFGWELCLAGACCVVNAAAFENNFELQALFTTFQFHFPITVALAQMVVMVPVCYIVAKPRLEWATAKAVFPLAVVNILNVVFGLVGEARTDQFICDVHPLFLLYTCSTVLQWVFTQQCCPLILLSDP